MNKRNMEKSINNWVLCPSKSFSGKFYYFNVLTGEAAWSLSEIENTRAMAKNNYIQKVNKWHTYPEPGSPPDNRYVTDPGWRRKPAQCLFSRSAMPVFGQPAFPMYNSQYMEPQLPNMMQGPPPMSSVFMEGMKREIDVQNMGGCDNDSYFLNMDKTKRFKPQGNLFNVGLSTSTPMKSQWPSYYQTNTTLPIFKQIQPKITPRMSENTDQYPSWRPKNEFESALKPRTIIKEPIFRQRQTQSDSSTFDNEGSVFRTKSFENFRSHDDSAYFDQTRHFQRNNTNFMQTSSVQTGRIFGTKSSDYLQTLDDSGCFEMPKEKSAIQKTLFSTQPDRNIRFTKDISKPNKKVSYLDNFKSELNPFRRAQSVLSGQETVNDKRKMNGENNGLDELGDNDLRYTLMAKRKKLENIQDDRTETKVKTSYSNRSEAAKKRVTFDIDFQSDDDDLPEENDEGDYGRYKDEAADGEAPLDTIALKGLAKPQAKTDTWYIVVDTEVLLEDFEFIETYVKTDNICRLLIPSAVRLEIETMSFGDCCGRERVIAARQLARKIASQPDYMTVQKAAEYEPNTSVSESVINCCLHAVDQKYHVVLITNDAAQYKKANSVNIPCFTLQDIRGGDSAPKQEVSFNIRKIVDKNTSDENNQCFTDSSSFSPFGLNSSSKISVASYRKRLFDEQKIDNDNSDALYFQNDESNVTDEPFEIPKTNQTTTKLTDCENFKPSDIFPPKNYRDYNEDQIETSETSSEIIQIEENVKKLIIQDLPRNIIIHDNGTIAKPENFKEKQQRVEEASIFFHRDETNAEERNTTRNKLKNINGYTIEQHLRKFDIKSKVVEERVKTRMEEWICSFSQIMEDILTYILQDYTATQSTLAPPWSLAEAVECVKDMYGDHSSVKIIVEKLSGLLYNCSCKKGKLSLNMTPKHFMTIFGLGILLIQCLTNVVTTPYELCRAEQALLSLLQLVTDPGVEPAPSDASPAATRSISSAEGTERKNFAKKPSEVIEYLKRHYPEWKSYKETTVEQDLQRDMDLLKVKDKQLRKKDRTFGKDLQSLKIDDNKTVISSNITNDGKTRPIKAKRFDSNDTKTAKKVKLSDTNLDDIETESACDKAIKATGARLLRKLAINSNKHKLPTLQNINVDKRDKSGKELVSMIHNMIDNTNNDVLEQKVADINDGNNNTHQVINENSTVADKETKFVRQLKNFTYRRANSQYNDDKNKTTPVNKAFKEFYNDPKHGSPKIIRNINLANPINDLTENTKLDLDALDYDLDYIKVDISQITIVNDNEANYDETNRDDAHKKIDDNKQTADGSLQNDERNGDEQNNEHIETDTTNDSGFENDNLQAYSLVKTLLTEISETFIAVYRFLSSTSIQLRKGRVEDGAKRQLHQTASESCKQLADMVANLESIVERESNDLTSIRTSLMKAGGEASNDPRIIRYSQVISNCLEQAGIFQDALKVVRDVTGPAPAYSDVTMMSSLSSNIKYKNIFA